MIPTPDTLRERLLSKIVMPGPATPCATWVGAYNRQGKGVRTHTLKHRPVIKGNSGRVVYAAPALLTLAAGPRPDGHVACHTCPTGTPIDRYYRCVDLAHLRWGTPAENEQDKRL